MAYQIATLQDGSSIEYDDVAIGSGGMKEVFLTKDQKNVVCFYRKNYQTPEFIKSQTERLERIINQYNPTLDPKTGEYFKKLYCWPTAIIKSPRFGLLVPKYPDHYFFDFILNGKSIKKEKEGGWFSRVKVRQQLNPAERGSLLTYLRLCKRMACAVRKLHTTGLAHSDLSNKNVLIDPKLGEAIVIDIDTLVVPALFPPDVIGTKDYIAPEVLKSLKEPTKVLPSNWTDLHALGVLIYEYLFQRHPLEGRRVWDKEDSEHDEFLHYGENAIFIENQKDPSNRPNPLSGVGTIDIIGPYLRDNFNRCFVEGLHDFSKRPSASSWEFALMNTIDRLIPCANPKCEEKYYVFLDNGHRPVCPYCHTELVSPLPIFDFYRKYKDGQHMNERHLLIGKDKNHLYEWHIFTDKTPDENANLVKLAYFQLHQGEWYLSNQSISSGFIVSNQSNILPSQSVKLIKDLEIIASQDENARMFRVRFTH